jgi:myosin heavy subunit
VCVCVCVCVRVYGRCLKPNANKTPGIIDNVLLGNQLRYTGVLDTVEIQRQGFATRLSFASFLYRLVSMFDIPITTVYTKYTLHLAAKYSRIFLRKLNDVFRAGISVLFIQCPPKYPPLQQAVPMFLTNSDCLAGRLARTR